MGYNNDGGVDMVRLRGGLSVILGSLFIAIYFIVRNTTSSLHYFETLPTYIPGVTVRKLKLIHKNICDQKMII